MKKINLIISLLVVMFLVSCTPSELECRQDSDCVANKCCHSDGAVNKAYAPDCEGILCSANCEDGTLDCGQGKIACVQNTCKVVFE